MNTQPQPFSQSTPVILYGQYIRTPIAIDWQQQTASFDISCVNPMRLVRKFDQLAALNPDIAFNTTETSKQPLETENISSMVDDTQSTQNAVSDRAGEAQDTNTAEASDRVLMTVQEARDFVATYEPPALPDAPLTVTEVTPDDDENYVEGDDDHDGWIDPDAGVQDDEPILSIMTHEPPTDSPAMPVTISDLKDIAGYVPVVDLHVPVRADNGGLKTFVGAEKLPGLRLVDRDELDRLNDLLSKANQERDALRAVIYAISDVMTANGIAPDGYGFQTTDQAKRLDAFFNGYRTDMELYKNAQAFRVEAETERDQLKTQRDAILTSARQHKAALKTLQAKVKDAITSGNLDLLKDATE